MKNQSITETHESNTQVQTTKRSGVCRAHTGARWLAAVLLAGAATATSAQQVLLYDDFAAGLIDPTKWIGDGGGRELEEVKLVSGGALLTGNVTYGDTGTDVGRPSAVTGISLTNTGAPGNLLGIGASVTMLAAASQDCIPNPATGRARANIRSYFFNNGASTGPGDATGDVAAGVQLVRQADGVDLIEYFVFRCDDAPCDNSTDLAFAPFTLNWSEGQARFLFIFWDAANDQFVFIADSEVVFAPYTEPADAAAPITVSNVLRARHSAENCTAGPPRSTIGFATFDDVIIVVP